MIISCYARGEGTPYDGLYGEAPPEIPERYLTDICTGRLRPEVQPLTRRESVLYLRLIPIYDSAGFQRLKGIQSSMQIVKGVPFVNRRYMKS